MRSPPPPCPLASVRLSSASSVGPLIRAVEAVTKSAVSQRQPPWSDRRTWRAINRSRLRAETCVSVQRLTWQWPSTELRLYGTTTSSRAQAFDLTPAQKLRKIIQAGTN